MRRPPPRLATAVTRFSPWQHVERQRRWFQGVELQIDFGPGYRVYFGKEGEHLIILLGTKQRQRRDINAAIANWEDYKRRK
jgi:putative addiction module killer protein